MTDVLELESAVRAFLASCREPALHEPGADLFPLTAGCHALEERCGRLSLRVWDERRTLTRRLLQVTQRTQGRLELSVERLGSAWVLLR